MALTLLIGVAATNTGNNALYMVVALMMAALIVSGVLSRNDVRKVEVEVTPPEELFARSPAAFQVEISNRSRLLPRWLLLVSFSDHAPTLLCPWLPRAGSRSAVVELEFPRRGVHRLAAAHLATLFPLGLFRKGMRQRLDREVVVFPSSDSRASIRCGGRPPPSARPRTRAPVGATTCTACACCDRATIRGASTGSRPRAPAA